MTLHGIVQNGLIVLEQGATLPEGTRVKVVAEPIVEQPRTAKELLMQFAGCMTDLPSDLAATMITTCTVRPSNEKRFRRQLLLYRSTVVMKEAGITEALTGDHHFEQAGFVVLLK